MNQSLSNNGYEMVVENPHDILSVLTSHRIALWEYDIPTGKCKFSDEYFQMLGLDKAGIHFEDLDGFYKYAHPADIERYQSDFARILADFTKDACIETKCADADGKWIYLEDHFINCKKDKEGRPEKLLAYTINVTQLHEKETKIKNLEDRNRKIIEALPEFIFIFDDNFFIRDVLMSPNTVLLHPVDDLINADGRSVYSPEVSELFVSTIRECLRDGELKEIEYPLDANNARFYFQARIAPFEGNTVLALIHDIGDRVKRSEELIEAKRKAEEADRMKSVFLANMSHEIRTPLNAIVGFSEIIAVTDDEAEKKEYLDIIQTNSSLLLQLINDILDLSRIESGKSEMILQPAEMGSLIDEIEKIHSLKMRPGVELKAIRPEGEFWISTDRNRVTQVLFNFLSNAIKNTEKGSITLGLASEDGWIKISVTDTGCGIPKEKLPLIFDRFEKLNEFAQGTGLGLSICKSIVERLGGRIDVESEFGVGTTFALYLPFTESLPVAPNLPTADHKKTPGRKKILIAEDIESNFAQINISLNKDYTILWVRNGQEAVDAFLREKPDLILMDIRMPVMNGIEAAGKIRAISPKVPIVAVTAHTYYPEQQQMLLAGCNALLAKPYSLERLRETIEAYI